jgi:nucleotide-binding universal stress UspA family protein
MYSKIILAVDGSEANRSAAIAAIEIAKAMGAEITAVYVVAGNELRPNAFGGDVSAEERNEIARKATENAFCYIEAKALEAKIKLETKVLFGKPCEEIIKITKDYDLLVCGSLGNTGIKKALLGSVSSKLTKYADCPVLISRART